jgi:hypothetical protein
VLASIIFGIYEEEEVFYNCCFKKLTTWQTFLISLWSLSMFAQKLCEMLQTLTISWLASYLKMFLIDP